jgi:integrase
MLLTATGMRATEALHIRVKDIDFEKSPADFILDEKTPKLKQIGLYF